MHTAHSPRKDTWHWRVDMNGPANAHGQRPPAGQGVAWRDLNTPSTSCNPSAAPPLRVKLAPQLPPRQGAEPE